MCNPFISIIVPVYNNAAYLPKCIESLLSQTYSYFELLLIDDGSKDGAEDICDKYALKDNRIRIFHQENSGVSVARNKGLIEAKGEYICFVDSDDWVKTMYLEDFIDAIFLDSSNGLIVQGLEQYTLEGDYLRSISFPDLTLSGMQMGEAFTKLDLHCYGYPWAKFYKLSILKEYKIFFNILVDHAEDLLFMIDYIKKVDYIRFCNKNNYVYMIHNGSLSNRNRSYITERTCYEMMKKNIQDIQYIYYLKSESLKKMENSTALFLIRALPALYRPPYALSKKERIKELKNLTDQDFDMIQKIDYPYRFLEKIGTFFLRIHFIELYDAYMSIVFFVRYRIVENIHRII